MSQDEREEEGGWDPFALGGYAEEDEQAADFATDFAREVSQGSAKPVRQGSLFRFALEAIERRKGDGRPEMGET
jgi:hypothetical protein